VLDARLDDVDARRVLGNERLERSAAELVAARGRHEHDGVHVQLMATEPRTRLAGDVTGALDLAKLPT
jgi:hypothetical protein